MVISRRQIRWLLLSPAGLWYIALLLLPLLVVFIYSFGERGATGGYAPGFSLAQYANLPSRWTAFKNTLMLAPAGMIAALAIAYPLAYFLAVRVGPKWKTLLLVLVIVPFWTSILIRSYAWIFLLGARGIPQLLHDLGLGDVRLLNTPFAVLIGIVYGYLPLMVFPIYVSLEKLDKRLLEAAGDLGAPPWRRFWQVTVPLSLPGVATGSMLVFILLMGEYLIPQMLGGGKVFFVGNALVDLFLQSRNWAFGSAVSMTLVAIMLIVVALYMRLLRRIGAARESVGLI
ncbi:ABC transporter permease [Brenneria goodwinii]|uniref:Spermidine Putrescine ABC transporter permease component PotB (TC 3.A.1.11.1) n=1 Tax=Brenneria goodwinii TaxID=1109412 RepID=A0A0G4JVG3_9GAMM|nr:ABC transporter permease [Brenneria goodwinii]CPR16847.1 Spermidine Putrescine ABC transporter permease component PotB (TC 3.A.1.11.1) [Brenneria goodwinii]